MDIATRTQYVRAHIDALSRDIDQLQGACDSALTAIIGAASDARDRLSEIRDDELAHRRQNQQRKQAQADSVAAQGHVSA